MKQVVRGYNILFIIIAQFISSIYILSENNSIIEVVSDLNIWLIIFSSAFSISAGYIINNVFDSEKDLINRPLKTTLEKLSRWYQFEKKQQEHRDKVKIGGSNYYQKEAN